MIMELYNTYEWRDSVFESGYVIGITPTLGRLVNQIVR